MNNKVKWFALIAAVAMMMPLAACGGTMTGGAQSAAQSIMQDVEAGNMNGVMGKVTVAEDRRNAQALKVKPSKTITDVTIGDSTKTGDGEYDVQVGYKLAGAQQATVLHLVKSGDDWKAVGANLFSWTFDDGHTTINGVKPKDGHGGGYLLLPGVYRVESDNGLSKVSWKETVAASTEKLVLDPTEHADASTTSDDLDSNKDVQQSLADGIAALGMCQTMEELYLNGKSDALVVGTSIPRRCVWNPTDVTSHITDRDEHTDGNGDFEITFDADITGKIKAEFKDSGETDDEWTCMSVNGGTQCARFVNATVTVKDLHGTCHAYGYCNVDQSEATDKIADIIYAGHGTV